MTARRRSPRLLASRTHVVFRLAPDLLLVFKPHGHREDEHRHPHRQRLRVLRGELVVGTGRRRIVLRPDSRPFTLAAGRAHVTIAAEDTWLVAESLPVQRVRHRSTRR